MASKLKLDASPFLARFLAESRTVSCLAIAPNGVIRGCNATMAAALGATPADLSGRLLWELVTEANAPSLRQRLDRAAEQADERFLLNFVDANGAPFTLECRCAADDEGFLLLGEPADNRGFQEEWLQLNNQLAVLGRESARRGKELESARARLEQALRDLEGSYWHLKKIQEVLPLCMECGQVKAGAGWESVADYLKKNALFLSHGYCPACLARLAARYGLSQEGPSHG